MGLKENTKNIREKASISRVTDGRVTLGRALLIVILFLLQLIWFILFLTKLSHYSAAAKTVLRIISLIMVLFVVNRNETPSYRISWLIIILAFPIFGGLFYLLFGHKRPVKNLAQQLNAVEEHHEDTMNLIPNTQKFLSDQDERLGSLSKYINNQGNMPLYPGGKADYYPVGEDMLADYFEDLRQAKEFIFLEYYIIKPGKFSDQVFEILADKVREGVEVRVIYDDFGSLMDLSADFVDHLEGLGIQAIKFNPFTPFFTLTANTRDHRKMTIIDGDIAYTGGLNLADEYVNYIERFGYWKDNVVRFEGGSVWNYTVLFLNMWNGCCPQDKNYNQYKPYDALTQEKDYLEDLQGQTPPCGYIQPYGDTPLDSEPLGESVYRDIVNNAVDYVYIYTPYLVISYEMQTTIELAAKRGVDVRIIVPGIPDKKFVYRLTQTYYYNLLQSGVRVFEFTPGFIHAKTFVSDDRIANVGSINLDYRSLYLNFENSVMFYYHPVIEDVLADFKNTLVQSKEITLDQVKETYWSKLTSGLLRVLAPLL